MIEDGRMAVLPEEGAGCAWQGGSLSSRPTSVALAI